MLETSDFASSSKIGPYYLAKNAVPIIDQDAGYWMLDTGFTRYSVDFISRRRSTRDASDSYGQHPETSIQDPDVHLVQLPYIKGVDAIFQQGLTDE